MAIKKFNLVEAMAIIAKIREIDINDFAAVANEDQSGTRFTYVLKGNSHSELINLGALEMYGHLLEEKEKETEIQTS